MSFLSISLIIVLLFFILYFVNRNKIYTIYKKYIKIENSANISGKELAFTLKMIFKFDFLQICKINGILTDGYNVKTKTLLLSHEVLNTTSLASIAIVSHEFGHIIQHDKNNSLLAINRILNKITYFTNRFIVPFTALGLLLYFLEIHTQLGISFFYCAIILFLINIIFKLLLIPLETNASKNALNIIKEHLSLTRAEIQIIKKMLTYASLTYITNFFEGFLIIKIKRRNKR